MQGGLCCLSAAPCCSFARDETARACTAANQRPQPSLLQILALPMGLRASQSTAQKGAAASITSRPLAALPTLFARRKGYEPQSDLFERVCISHYSLHYRVRSAKHQSLRYAAT